MSLYLDHTYLSVSMTTSFWLNPYCWARLPSSEAGRTNTIWDKQRDRARSRDEQRHTTFQYTIIYSIKSILFIGNSAEHPGRTYLIPGLDCGPDYWSGLMDWITASTFELYHMITSQSDEWRGHMITSQSDEWRGHMITSQSEEWRGHMIFLANTLPY